MSNSQRARETRLAAQRRTTWAQEQASLMYGACYSCDVTGDGALARPSNAAQEGAAMMYGSRYCGDVTGDGAGLHTGLTTDMSHIVDGHASEDSNLDLSLGSESGHSVAGVVPLIATPALPPERTPPRFMSPAESSELLRLLGLRHLHLS